MFFDKFKNSINSCLKNLFFFKNKKKYRILYLSAHSILEYDEIKILEELGHFVFSPGTGSMHLRPSKNLSNEEIRLKKEFYSLADKNYYKNSPLERLFKLKTKLSKKFVSNFDIIIVMHYPECIINNWSVIKNKKVIWRTIGQSNSSIEKKLKAYRQQGLKIIRYSPFEKNIPNYIGEDEIIRFYKNEKEFSNWNGQIRHVLTVSQHMEKRFDACHYDIYERVVRDLPYYLAGFKSKGINDNSKELSYEELKDLIRNSRCFFYTGTYPASYTLAFIEAWMTGIPIIAIGNELMHDRFPDQGLYEIPSLIINGYNGYCYNSIEELKNVLLELLNDFKLAKKISKNGRKSAKKIFGSKRALKQWSFFIEKKIWK